MRALLLAVLLGCTGCSVGVGSAYVGQWRAHDEVEYRACLEDAAGKCVAEKESVKHVPERSYYGVIIPYPALGAARVTHDGDTRTRFRMEPSLEVLRGKGRAAYGVRTGAVLDIRDAIFVPVMLLGHYSLHERFSVHAGLGGVPYARRGKEEAFLGGRGLLGFQWALGRVRSETYWVFSAEADTTLINFDAPYRATGLTGHLGIFF